MDYELKNVDDLSYPDRINHNKLKKVWNMFRSDVTWCD
jgi:hypothetical protein